MSFFIFLLWMFSVMVGPGLLIYLLVFHPRKMRLHRAYLSTGVLTLGIVTHRKIVVTRGSLTRIERSRTHHIRYVYKAPGTSVAYHKDFCQVKAQDLQRRFIAILVLPGQPSSGVPRFLLSDGREDSCCLIGAYIFIGIMTLIAVFSTAAISAEIRGINCTGNVYDDDDMCSVAPADIGIGLAVSFFLGFIFALFMDFKDKDQVPGKIWRTHQCGPGPADAVATPVGTTESTAHPADYEQMDNREIPVAHAVAILDNDDFQNQFNDENDRNDNTTNSLEFQEEDDNSIPAFARAVVDDDDEGNNDQGQSQRQQTGHAPLAKAVELV